MIGTYKKKQYNKRRMRELIAKIDSNSSYIAAHIIDDYNHALFRDHKLAMINEFRSYVYELLGKDLSDEPNCGMEERLYLSLKYMNITREYTFPSLSDYILNNVIGIHDGFYDMCFKYFAAIAAGRYEDEYEYLLSNMDNIPSSIYGDIYSQVHKSLVIAWNQMLRFLWEELYKTVVMPIIWSNANPQDLACDSVYAVYDKYLMEASLGLYNSRITDACNEAVLRINSAIRSGSSSRSVAQVIHDEYTASIAPKLSADFVKSTAINGNDSPMVRIMNSNRIHDIQCSIEELKEKVVSRIVENALNNIPRYLLNYERFELYYTTITVTDG